MELSFCKFHGNGNDFIAIENLNQEIDLKNADIQAICHRKFGIGADGVIEIRKHKDADFELIYYNSDGCIGSMCGNGGRCAVAFASMLGVFTGRNVEFMAYDGIHKAVINAYDSVNEWDISLQLSQVLDIEIHDSNFFLDTGSPHHVEFVDNVNDIDVLSKGREIRNSAIYQPNGTNVNFVERRSDFIFVRTFERGVEDETLSCGTGVTASAIATGIMESLSDLKVRTRGGDFIVSFDYNKESKSADNIWLRGPAKLVFEGKV